MAMLVALILKNYQMNGDIQVTEDDARIEYNNEAFIRSRGNEKMQYA